MLEEIYDVIKMDYIGQFQCVCISPKKDRKTAQNFYSVNRGYINEYFFL